MKRTLALLLTVCMMLTLLPTIALAAEPSGFWTDERTADPDCTFDGGSGTEESPYLIASADQLAQLAVNVNSGTDYDGTYFKLMADIDLSEKYWVPIGTDANEFKGTFDGDGHTVDGININNTSADCQGLFGAVGLGGSIKNVGVINSDINGLNYVGGVCGYTEGTITNCYNTGKVSGTDQIGGVCGRNYDTVTNCYNTGKVSGTSNIGGVCGWNHSVGTITNCYNTVEVSGNDFVGGMCGNNCGTITNCYNTGKVSGNDFVGGVCGDSSTITNCYNTGKVSGTSNIGGVCGGNGGTITNCYKTGEVSGNYFVDGVCGYNCGTITRTTEKTTTEMQSQAMTDELNDGGAEWGYDANINGGYPYLVCFRSSTPAAATTTVAKTALTQKSVNFTLTTAPTGDYKVYSDDTATVEHSTVTASLTGLTLTLTDSGEDIAVGDYYVSVTEQGKIESGILRLTVGEYVIPPWTEGLTYDQDCTFDGGSGTEESPYLIATAEQLAQLAVNVNGGTPYDGTYFKLSADIDLSSKYWVPIGTDANHFMGIFDGDEHTVDGININNTSANYQGLFGFVGLGGSIKNVGVINSNIKGSNNVGGVCGRNNGTITSCYNTGEVSGYNFVGGVCGSNSGTITNCYNTGTVTGTGNSVGGVCGYNETGTITSCYNTGTVTRTGDKVGGVCGYNKNGTITNCYNTGIIAGHNRIGGVCGDNEYGTITNCYNTGAVEGSGNDYFGGVCGNNYNSTITSCYNTGTVTGTGDKVGGVCGYNFYIIENCYNTGAVSGSNSVGGVCGKNYNTSANCYNTGAVSGSNSVGGVCGENYRIITNCYNTGAVSGSNSVGDVCGENYRTIIHAMEKTTTEMQSQAMTDELNDGCAEWGYDANINDGYPYLVSFLSAIPTLATTTVAKTSATQKSVSFTLTTAPTGIYKVYANDTTTVEHSTVTASLTDLTLTLADSSADIAVGDYYISVTEQGKLESSRLRLTLGAYVPSPVRTGGGGTSSYTVTFETNSGNKLSSKRLTRNSVLSEPAVPTNEGYIFEGWYTDKELTAKYDFDTKITKAFTLYAKWTKDLSNKIILKIGEKETLVFGKTLENDVAPIIRNDRTMLPARFVSENLGATVAWDENEQKVTITKADITIVITIGSDKALVNDKDVELDSPAFIENGRTYTPLRFIVENLGATVVWDEQTQEVTITKK